MAEAARRYGSGLGADVARRLLARPIQRQAVRPVRSAALPQQAEPTIAEPTAAEPIVVPDLTRKLEAQIRIMKAVLAAERRENESLRTCIGMDDEPLGEEARAVRNRWAGIVDRLLHAAV